MQTVAETSIFQKRAAALLSEDEYSELIAFLAENPEAGDEIVGTGGVRKVRFAAGGKGKSGGARVIYYYYAENAPLYALMIYDKNEKADLSAADRKAVSVLAAAIKKAAKQRK
ncbi:RelE-like cytotoxic translational repressor of toxin-antitoxin stability system [Parvibaculum lavamentivorans DS-1]|uniref:RelE-like cytotoxic translational repressor of toxin-antitoxin stability system n=2 Tax=Parvibaculum lavamentivorans TaxID=256618 RepID=A7HUI6_PARL1|nr:RelE-like cytotoxic translational repressor of toxin-antitoxin stability system [Parvibaculum lavamentivorans DS-1]